MTGHHVYIPRSKYKHIAVDGIGPGLPGTRTLCGKHWANYASTVETAARPVCPSCSSLLEQERRSAAMANAMSHFGRS